MANNEHFNKVFFTAIVAIVGTFLIIRYLDKNGILRPIGESKDNDKFNINVDTVNINNYFNVDYESDYREFAIKEKTKLKRTYRNSYDEAKERLLTFKKYIEDRKAHKIFQSMHKVREDVLYPMFAMLCDNSEYDINQQVNNGGGSSDFNFSYGSEDITIVEFKLARTLKDNFIKQVDIYKEDNNTNKGLIAIVYFNAEEKKDLDNMLGGLNPNSLKDIVIINASSDDKVSASKI